jgi:hypothetical protein
MLLCLLQGKEKVSRSGALRVLDHDMTGVANSSLFLTVAGKGKEKVAVRRTARAGSC